MDKHLATSERERLCAMCGKYRIYPPATLCDRCDTYIADCAAELGSER